MFKLIIPLVLILTTNVYASLDCARVNGRLYPVNESAIKVAEHLKVSTCSGDIYKLAAERLNTTINVVDAPQSLIERLDQERAQRQASRLEGLSL